MATDNHQTPTSTTASSAPTPSKRPKMPGFIDSFWSADYAGGLGILFTKLQQGVTENQQVLTIASMRADSEEIYASRLGDIAPAVEKLTGGFGRDDGATTKKAYEGVRNEMIEASKNHTNIANNIRELVVNPFSRWCDAHATRVQNSQDELQSKIKAHDRQAELVKKLRSAYFNKCRLVEDLEEENKLAFKEPDTVMGSPTAKNSPGGAPPKIVLPDEEEELPVEIGDEIYSPEKLKAMMTGMLNTISMGEHRVPILGTYQNISTGTDIVDYLQKHLGASSVGYAEKMGQDLIDRGFLRLIGNVGNQFANSSRMRYQWKMRAFQVTGIPEKKKPLGRVSSASSQDGSIDNPMGNITETLQAWNPMNNPYPNETPAERLKRESKETDEKYKVAVRRLDLLRCNLEESMMDHLKFLERCEGDRLKAIKSVILDFSGTISNSIPSFQSQVDHMMLYQETIQPVSDLRYFLENYRTGAFVPRVTPYENYYGSVDDQVFGVDLEARARADRKRVPIIVTSILTYLDNHYPDLEGDEARRSIWLVDVPLAATHHLRNQINGGTSIAREVLERYEIPIVASVLKLYLLELPDSLVSSQVYEIIKTIYNSTSDPTPNPIALASPTSPISTPRIKVLQSTLGQLRLNNIATLDAITTHFTRLIDLTSADEEYTSRLAQILAPCILRPRTENGLTLEDRHAVRLVRDLFEHKEAIFGELKRQSSTLSGSNSVRRPGPAGDADGGSAGANDRNERQRAVSAAKPPDTDEGSRRARMEERAEAISKARTRDKSPNPSMRHRRDKSTDGGSGGGGGGVMGRFPVVASPRPGQGGFPTAGGGSGGANQTNKRTSLEVPEGGSPVQTRYGGAPTQGEAHTRLAALTQERTSNALPTATLTPSSGAANSHTATAINTSSNTTANGHYSSPSQDFMNSPYGGFSGSSGGPGPHIPPPVDDEDSPVSDVSRGPDREPSSFGGNANEAAFGQNAGVSAVNSSGKVGSLKRTTGSGKKVNRGTGSLREAQEESRGVQLQDRPMDD